MKNFKTEITGYKVFDPDWKCRDFQYKVGEKYEMKEAPICCKRGFHFCKKLAHCFNYYSFNPNNKVAEVVAFGDKDKTEDKICTNAIYIKRELSWEEVLEKANIGDNNTGINNTGDYNTGAFNSGNHNIGNFNTGNYNGGNRNSGRYNCGNANVGSGNSGDYNVGGCNEGAGNVGFCNKGRYNVGDFNAGSHHIGCFNTYFKSKITMFNRKTNWTYDEWVDSKAYSVLTLMPTKVVINNDDAKSHYPELLTKEELRCKRQLWWGKLSEDDRKEILSLPNFDAKIFKECTDIDVQKGGK